MLKSLHTHAVSVILNCSYNQGKLPSIWKSANISPILRPISLTQILSKIAEEFILERHLKSAFFEDPIPQTFWRCCPVVYYNGPCFNAAPMATSC
jgi:hypothetical protein